jgi:thioredoxin 1
MRKLAIVAIVLSAGLLAAFSFGEKNKRVAPTMQTETTGIKFSNLTFEEALKLSKTTGKPVFVDCYTTWCGPCKMLAARTFTSEKVGAFFNENFINLQVEMEKDADGPFLMRRYSVNAYPTLIFVNSKGELIKKSLGFVTPDQLLEVAKQVIK